VAIHEFDQWNINFSIGVRQLIYPDLEKLEWYGQFKHLRNIFSRSFMGQQDGSRFLLVADCNDFPVGRMFILLNGKNKDLSDGKNRAYLYSFQVMDMFQRQGIGTKLLESAEALLINRHYKFATIAVAKTNKRALSLYQKHRYEIFSENDGKWSYRDHQGKMREVDEPSWFMFKRLG